ncbi:MAG TPA: hypothetical protein VHI13_09310, partial [Candidatus Kapabacteria bacterium]|nr:hypothetical protein [Candidatus Kapabacteria bacterium]
MNVRVSNLPARIALLTILLYAFCAPMPLRSQSAPVLDPAASGTLYYVAFPDTVGNVIDPRYPNQRVTPEVSLFMFSAVNTHVRITALPSYTNTVTLQGGTAAAVTLPQNSYVTTINNVTTRVYKVQADDPIVLYCYMATAQSVEAWTPAPVVSWGTSYRSASIQGGTVQDIGVAGTVEIPSTPKGAPAEILVIAAYDSTVVYLEPPDSVAFVGNRQPMVVVLNAGQAFQVQSRVTVVARDTVQEDIAGTRITATQPIGVISGNTRTQTEPDSVIGGPGIKGNIYRAPLFEWLSPAEEYGKRFVYLPTWDSHRSGIGSGAERLREHVRIYNDGRTTLTGRYLTPNGLTSVPFTVAAGSSLLVNVVDNAALQFITDAPAQAMMHSSAVVNFEGSTPCYGGVPCTDWSGWAPYMVEMTPREQWTSFAPYYAPTNPGNMQHYIDVVTDTVSAK